MENVFTALYAFIPLIGMTGYVPQIRTLLLSRATASDISLPTWFLWMLTWVISLGYGVVCLQDWLFSLTCSINLAGHVTIIALVMYKKHAGMPLKAFVS